MGADANFPANLHGGYAQCWSWKYDPDDGWVYVVSTGFQRNKGIILMRSGPDTSAKVWVLRAGATPINVGAGAHADTHHPQGRGGAS